jgi:pyruvate,water dikinase
MNAVPDYTRWFSTLRNSDVSLVGGKNASLGELYSCLATLGVKVPNGFALTAQSYYDALTPARMPGSASTNFSTAWMPAMSTGSR